MKSGDRAAFVCERLMRQVKQTEQINYTRALLDDRDYAPHTQGPELSLHKCESLKPVDYHGFTRLSAASFLIC